MDVADGEESPLAFVGESGKGPALDHPVTLVVSKHNPGGLRFAEEARVTALREAANIEGSNAIKTAILRKTTAMKEYEPQPGHRVGVWSDTGRKRGGKVSKSTVLAFL